MSDSKIHLGVNVVLQRGRAILLGKRFNVFGSGTWGLPGGHLEYGESLVEGAKRELDEEIGVTADLLEFLSIVDQPFRPDTERNGHYIQINFLCTSFFGEPELKEPNACSEWKWFMIDNLPQDLFFPHVQILDSLRESKYFIG